MCDIYITLCRSRLVANFLPQQYISVAQLLPSRYELFVFIATASVINKRSLNLALFNVRGHLNGSILSEENIHCNCTRKRNSNYCSN